VALFSWFSTWLRPAKANKRVFADIAQAREFIMSAAEKRPGVDSAVADPVDPAKFKITMGEWSSTADVTNIFGYLNAYPDENAEKAIGRFINAVAEAKVGSVDEDNIVAVVRNREYVDSIDKNLGILHEPLGADLMILYMIDRPDSMSPLKTADLPGKDLASVRNIALHNVRQWLPKVVSNDELGVGNLYYVDDNAMLSTSLILLDDFWNSIAARFAGDVLLALPRKDQLFIFDDDGNQATRMRVRRLIDTTIDENFNLLSPMLYARRRGEIVIVPD